MNSNKKKRYKDESLRKKHWDYSSPGSYFLTIDTADHRYVLGKIKDNKMYLSESGKIVEEEIQKLITYNPRIILNKWVVMPNHVHILLTLDPYPNKTHDTNNSHDVHDILPERMARSIHELAPIPKKLNLYPKEYRIACRKMIIPKLVGKFKTQTSKKINQLLNTPGKKNWHNDYWDVIILSEEDFRRTWHYIEDNPKKWWGKHKKRRP